MVNAFVNALHDPSGELVVCYLLDGYKIEGMVAIIDRVLYGLRDSPAIWFKDFTKTLVGLGLKLYTNEPCILISKDQKVLVLFFVDDVQVIYNKSNIKAAERIIEGIRSAYELCEMGDTEWFLGVRIIRDYTQKKLWLVHNTYIEKIARKFDLAGKRIASTPLPTIEFKKYEGVAVRSKVKEYQEKVGSILYIVITLYVDIVFAVSQLSHFLTNPSEEHIAAADHCISYLWGTRYLAIEYGTDSSVQLLVASDTSFADDNETRRSSQGYMISLYGGLIIWKASKQDTVTISTTEAELLGVKRTAKEIMATTRLLKELELAIPEPVTIFCDNT
jgi:hypothetical protein